ncbi:MAG: hypothetical protein ACOC7W_00735 [Desulfosalsimonas sp.]
MGLIARHAEAAGVPTLYMGSAYDVMRAVNPPRGAFLDFPLGHTTGKPGQPQLQREILRYALDCFNTISKPGSITTLPFQWDEEGAWKKEMLEKEDQRLPRHDTPQYQSMEDRARAEAGDTSAIGLCGCEMCTAVNT